jgi:uncharacterized cupredoxin-like copper-binding protein
MKRTVKSITRVSLIAASVALASATAWANGTHAHSHSHGHGASVIGQPGKASKVSRTINVDMTDNMRFTPANLTVKKGETVRLVVKNSGKLKHELVLGTPQDLTDHYKQMLKFPGMVHEDPQMVSVDPGATGEIIWAFDRAGVVDFACLQPGHFDAGMVGKVAVK